MEAQIQHFGGFVLRSQAEIRLPRADWESGPSQSDLRGPVSDLLS